MLEEKKKDDGREEEKKNEQGTYQKKRKITKLLWEPRRKNFCKNNMIDEREKVNELGTKLNK